MLPPLAKDQVEKVVGDFSVTELAFLEFMTRFAGLRDAMPPNSGGFAYDAAEPFKNDKWSRGIEDAENEWLQAHSLYYAPNADRVLINRDGQTAWFFHAEARIEPYTESFDEFLAKYAHICKNFTCGFDAYSARDPH